MEGKVGDEWEILKELEGKRGVKVKFEIVREEGVEERAE